MNRFVKFGQTGTQADRAQAVEALHKGLDGLPQQAIADNKLNAMLYEVMHDATILKAISAFPGLKEDILTEVLQYVEQTHTALAKQIDFGKEMAALAGFKKLTPQKFQSHWQNINSELRKFIDALPAPSLNIGFYDEQLNTIVEAQDVSEKLKAAGHKVRSKSGNKNKAQRLTTLQDKIAADWQAHLDERVRQAELEQIDNFRKQFLKTLYQKIDRFKRLAVLLTPFTSSLGRLWDLSKGRWQHSGFDVLEQYADVLQHEEGLQQLAEMLGELRAVETELEEEQYEQIRIQQKWLTDYAQKAELVGIHESNDLNNMLPIEVALLSEEATESVFYKRFTEHKLQTFRFAGKIPVNTTVAHTNTRLKPKAKDHGPIIVCVDTSGSMQGTPERIAKTLVFALLKIALAERRRVFLIAFSTQVETLELTNIEADLGRLIQFLQFSFYGGTDASPALLAGITQMKQKGYTTADLLMVTDGVIPDFDQETKETALQLKQEGNHFYSLIIGLSGNEEALSLFDANWQYDLNDSRALYNLLDALKQKVKRSTVEPSYG